MPNMEGIQCVLLDIEGTVCPISFVKKTLFPYAIKALPSVLARKWDSADFQPYRNAFPEQYRHDPDALQAHVQDLTQRDVKIAYLKNLQGFLWQDGYKTGAYSTSLFADVVPALQKWKADGFVLAIYSSGSVFAQKLLFGHVAMNDAAASRKRGRVDDDDEAEDQPPPPPKSTKILTTAQQDGDGEGEGGEDDGGVDPQASNGNDGDAVAGAAEEAPAADDAGNAPRDDDDDENEKVPTSGGQDDDDGATSSTNQTTDLTGLFQDWFDTTNAGLKTESSSYSKIAAALKLKPEEILFLSDNVKEVDAATEAKMKSILVDRPGNAPVSEEDRKRLQLVDSLSEIQLSESTDKSK